MQNHSISKVLPLSQEEQFFKSIYLKYPEANLNEPNTIRNIHHMIPELSTHVQLNEHPELILADYLPEQNFPKLLDIMLVKHSRYAPAFKHAHSFFEIICVLEGFCKNNFTGQTLSMQTGDICIIAPGNTHALSVFTDDAVVYNLMVRSETFADTFLKSLPEQGILYTFFSHALYTPDVETYLYFQTTADNQLIGILEEMYLEYSSQKKYYHTLLNALLTNFFIKLLRKHEKDLLISNPTGKKANDNIIFILKYIMNHYDTATLSEVSQFFNYSNRQMARLLKDYTGKTFTELMQNAKLEKACELLKVSSLSIPAVINATGYTNYSHFYRIFKEQYRLTPAEYRKKFALETKII